MVEAEFDVLWVAQAAFNSVLFNNTAHDELKDALLFQRPLKPVIPGRCTLLPDEMRAPLALPSTQRFRIYQELANLRILTDGLKEQALTIEQRNKLAQALETGHKSFKTAIPKLLGMSGTAKFNLADAKRLELKGNVTCAILSKKDFFGDHFGSRLLALRKIRNGLCNCLITTDFLFFCSEIGRRMFQRQFGCIRGLGHLTG